MLILIRIRNILYDQCRLQLLEERFCARARVCVCVCVCVRACLSSLSALSAQAGCQSQIGLLISLSPDLSSEGPFQHFERALASHSQQQLFWGEVTSLSHSAD